MTIIKSDYSMSILKQMYSLNTACVFVAKTKAESRGIFYNYEVIKFILYIITIIVCKYIEIWGDR